MCFTQKTIIYINQYIIQLQSAKLDVYHEYLCCFSANILLFLFWHDDEKYPPCGGASQLKITPSYT